MSTFDLEIENYELEDLLNLFKLQYNFVEADLKKAYRMALKLHPDKSGLDAEYFRFYMKAYKMVENIFNFRNRKWSNAVDPSIFGGLKVKSMAIEKDIIFLSTINGVIKFDMRKNFMNIYNYTFIGEVNDMYIKGRKLWLGTSEGLISFQYK